MVGKKNGVAYCPGTHFFGGKLSGTMMPRQGRFSCWSGTLRRMFGEPSVLVDGKAIWYLQLSTSTLHSTQCQIVSTWESGSDKTAGFERTTEWFVHGISDLAPRLLTQLLMDVLKVDPNNDHRGDEQEAA